MTSETGPTVAGAAARARGRRRSGGRRDAAGAGAAAGAAAAGAAATESESFFSSLVSFFSSLVSVPPGSSFGFFGWPEALVPLSPCAAGPLAPGSVDGDRAPAQVLVVSASSPPGYWWLRRPAPYPSVSCLWSASFRLHCRGMASAGSGAPPGPIPGRIWGAAFACSAC